MPTEAWANPVYHILANGGMMLVKSLTVEGLENPCNYKKIRKEDKSHARYYSILTTE